MKAGFLTGIAMTGLVIAMAWASALASTSEERRLIKSLEEVDSLVAALTGSPEVQSIRISRTEPVFARLMKDHPELLRVFRTNSNGVMLVEYRGVKKSMEKFPDSSRTTWYRRIQNNQRNPFSRMIPGTPSRLLRVQPYYVRQGKKYAGVVGVEANLTILFQKALADIPGPICILQGGDTLFQRAWNLSLPVEKTAFETRGSIALRVLKYRGLESAGFPAENRPDAGPATGALREKAFDWPEPLSKTVLGKGYVVFHYLTGMALFISWAGLMYVLYAHWRDRKKGGAESAKRRYHYLTALLLAVAAVYLSLRGWFQYRGWRHALESAQVSVNQHFYDLEKGRRQFAPVQTVEKGESSGFVRSPFSGERESTVPPTEGRGNAEPLVLKAIIPTRGGEPFAVFLMGGRYRLGQAGEAVGEWTLTRVNSHEVFYENASTQKRADLLGRIETTAKIGR